MLYDYNKLIFFIQFLAECSLIHSSYDDFVILFSMERKKDDSFFFGSGSPRRMLNRIIWQLLRIPKSRMLPRPIKSELLGPRH